MADLSISVNLNAAGVQTGVARVRRSLASMDESFKGIRATLTSFAGNVAAGAFIALSQQLQQGAKALLDYSSRMQQTSVAFETLMGSAVLAQKHLSDLKKFAVDTPFEFESLAKMSQRLQSVGVAAEEVIPLMRDIGNVTSATGEISAARVEGITIALTQMISKTKVSAEEMEQLAERGVPAWKILSESIGQSQAAVRKLAEDGKITSEEMVQALQKISREKFGDAMEKQSKTFAGTLSTISDTIQQVAATAFEPLFKEINELAGRFSRSVQAQGNDFRAVGTIIIEYVGEGMVLATGKVVENVGSLLIDDFTKKFTRGEFADPISSAFITGVLRGIGVLPEASQSVQSLNNTLSNTGQTIDSVANSTAKFNRELSEIQRRGDEARKEIEAVGKIIDSLTLQIRFYGDESQVAATKQQLLSQGYTDFTTAQARSALAYAQVLDNLKRINELQEEDKRLLQERTDKIRDLGEQLQQMQKDVEFDIQFPKATELERFDRWVKENAASFRELAAQVNATRRAIASAQFIANLRESSSRVADVILEINEAARTSDPERLNQFNESLREIAKSLDLKIIPGEFAQQVGGFIAAYDTLIKNFRGGNVNEAADGLNLIKESLRNFLLSLRDINNVGIGDLKEVDDLIDAIFRLKTSLGESAGRTFISDLDEEILQLNIELGRSAELSRADAAAKELQKAAYQNLTPEIIAQIKAKAAEVDQLREAVKAQEEARRAYDEVYGTIRDSLDTLANEDFGAFLKNIQRKFQDFLLDLAAEWLTSQFFQLFFKGGNQQQGQASGSGNGGIFGGILNAIFGGGVRGQGPGGTPVFNPNAGTGAPGTSVAGGGLSTGIGLASAGGGIFGSGRSGSSGRLAGTLGLVGGAAAVLGGAIGGRVGGFISNIGSGVALGASIGSAIPGIGTAIGAVIGGAAGFFASLFGGDPKRKRDKKEKIPALNKGFSDALQQLRDLVRDTRTLRVDPDSAISKAVELRSAIASGFDIQFESKKYRKIAQTQIAAKLREADALIEEVRAAAEFARAAGERQRRIIPEFATGVFMSRNFIKEIQQYRERNGVLSGGFRGRDTLPSMLSAGEMVLNPRQQASVRQNAGFDAFAGAGIPGYGGNSANGGQQSGGPINMTFVFEHQVDSNGMVRTAVKNSPDVQREITVVVEDKYANGELKLRNR